MARLLRAQGAFAKHAGNDNVPVHWRLALNAAVAAGVAALAAGIAVFHSLAIFL